MLPAPKTHRFSLADVMPSSLDALLGVQNPLSLPAVDKAVVLLVDGLGARPLAARAGHARTLAPMLSKSSIIGAGFPTTTASALATLTTGVTPGTHGLVGYSVLQAERDRVVNQLTGWDEELVPESWQRVPTVFERAAPLGIPSFVVAAERYRSSGFTRAVLRGAEYRSGSSIEDRLAVARGILDQPGRALVYVYVPELDVASHAHGWQSDEWIVLLEQLDAAVGAFAGSLRAREGLLLTADHGVLDVPPHAHVLVDEQPGLVDDVRFIAGEPRCLQLYLEPGADAAAALARWTDAEGHRAFVASRADAVAAGWFGDSVHEEVLPRIGDIIVAARKSIAYYDGRVKGHNGRTMVGQHGSLSDEETAIPLLRFGAFAR